MEMTLVHRIRELADIHTSDDYLTLLFADRDPENFSYPDLVRHALRFTRLYQDAGLKQGDRIIIIHPHDKGLYFSHLGALLGGFIPAMFAFPSPKFSDQEYFRTIGTLIEGAQARLIITYGELEQKLKSAGLPTTCTITTPSCAEHLPPSTAVAPRRKEDVAILQYSSGTTGLKKGVALSHQAILSQIEQYSKAIGLRSDDRIVSWLPLYHDMGFIACYLLPLLTRTRLIAMSPFDWVKSPAMLLHAITCYGGTLCWLPNFAYNFMANSISNKDLTKIRLHSVRGFVNCSEPIMASSHDLFVRKFAACGLKPEALAASYALAEHTFAATSGGFGTRLMIDRIDAEAFSKEGRAQPIRNGLLAREVISSGKPLEAVSLSIVDDAGQPLAERTVGEIVLGSPCLFEGYFNAENGSGILQNAVFRTGDLGYIADGHLFVIGRKNDTMIIAGKNIFPQDIEAIVNEVPGVIPGRCVAFAIPDEGAGTEALCIVAETHEATAHGRKSLIRAIGNAVGTRSEAIAKDIVLQDHMSLVKSTSGKISRSANRQRYLEQRNGTRTSHRAATKDGAPRELKDTVRTCVLQVIGARPSIKVDDIRDDEPLISSGMLDSFSVATLIAALENEFNVAFPQHVLTNVMDFNTVQNICTVVGPHLETAKQPSTTPANAARWYDVIARSMISEADRQKYAIAPQLKDAQDIGTEPHPILGRRMAPNFRSASLCTDENGFRIAIRRNKVLPYDEFLKGRHRRGVILGNSTAFGVGTSKDATTFANQVNGVTSESSVLFYNFALRASDLRLERLAGELYCTEPVACVVMISGMNSLTHFLIGEFHRAQAGGDYDAQGFIVRYKQMTREVRGEIHALKERFRARVLFGLQPVYTWLKKNPSWEERELLARSDASVTDMTDIIVPSQLYADSYPRYAAELAEICKLENVDWVDFNQDARFLENKWLFVDRAHLTDEGHRIIAETILEWLRRENI